MLQRVRFFAQITGYLLIALLSIFGLMIMLRVGTASNANAANLLLVEEVAPVAVPSSMNYQGILRDGDGNLIETGEYDLTFKIYEDVATSTALYEQSQTGIIVRDGRFSTTLSDVPATVFTAGSDRFIGVTVDPFAEMVPRERLASVPYAMQAEDAFNGVPVGGVVDWWRPNASVSIPDGFQLCDGNAVADPDSPYFGENTPDLRGQMIRGAIPSSNELAQGGSAQQTVDFSNGTSVSQAVNTAVSGGHNHGISGQTGTVSSVGGDPGNINYLVSNNDSGDTWDTQSHLLAGGGTASASLGEGNHYHTAGTLAVVANGAHFHPVTIPALSHTGTQTIDTVPPYTNLLKICRTR